MAKIFGTVVFFGVALLFAGTACSLADEGGELDLSRRVKTLDARFERTPDFPVGHADPLKVGETAPSLSEIGGRWRAGYIQTKLFRTIKQPPWIGRGQPYPGFAWINHELASYPNGDAIRSLGLDVVKVENNELLLSAQPASPAVRELIPEGMDTPYVSGAVNSFPFAQTYGYFELEAKLPKGPGIWPAFWLLPVDNTWPPEIDVVEVLGRDPTTMYVSLHPTKSDRAKIAGSKPIRIPDPSADYHRYGVEWDSKDVKWYFDRKLVHTEKTPPSLIDRPFYLLANVAVGNPRNWGGSPDNSTVFPAVMRIRAIRAWSGP